MHVCLYIDTFQNKQIQRFSIMWFQVSVTWTVKETYNWYMISGEVLKKIDSWNIIVINGLLPSIINQWRINVFDHALICPTQLEVVYQLKNKSNQKANRKVREKERINIRMTFQIHSPPCYCIYYLSRRPRSIPPLFHGALTFVFLAVACSREEWKKIIEVIQPNKCVHVRFACLIFLAIIQDRSSRAPPDKWKGSRYPISSTKYKIVVGICATIDDSECECTMSACISTVVCNTISTTSEMTCSQSFPQ